MSVTPSVFIAVQSADGLAAAEYKKALALNPEDEGPLKIIEALADCWEDYKRRFQNGGPDDESDDDDEETDEDDEE